MVNTIIDLLIIKHNDKKTYIPSIQCTKYGGQLPKQWKCNADFWG